MVTREGTMARRFVKASLPDAVGHLRPGMRVLLPPGCGEPVSLVAEICRQAERLSGLTLMGGIHLGDYPWTRPEHAALRYLTWHMSPLLEEPRREGRVEFVPVRYFDLVSLFGRGGWWAPDCVVVHTAPPDAGGYLSLGVSTGIVLPAAREAPLVIAQINPQMPRAQGNAFLHRSQIDVWAETDVPLVPYPPPPVGEVERAIGRHTAVLVPDGATVQVGVGAIPQAVLEALTNHRDLALHSLLVDAAVSLVERGVVTCTRKTFHRGRMDIAEAMGTRRLFEFIHEQSMVNMESSAFVHDPEVVARIDRLRCDQLGSGSRSDRTSERGEPGYASGRWRRRSVRLHPGCLPFGRGEEHHRPAVDGPGGSVSRIVARLPTGTAVTTPRYAADSVVTEFGTAQLRGRGERERAAALIAIAHPKFGGELERSLTV